MWELKPIKILKHHRLYLRTCPPPNLRSPSLPHKTLPNLQIQPACSKEPTLLPNWPLDKLNRMMIISINKIQISSVATKMRLHTELQEAKKITSLSHLPLLLTKLDRYSRVSQRCQKSPTRTCQLLLTKISSSIPNTHCHSQTSTTSPLSPCSIEKKTSASLTQILSSSPSTSNKEHSSSIWQQLNSERGVGSSTKSTKHGSESSMKIIRPQDQLLTMVLKTTRYARYLTLIPFNIQSQKEGGKYVYFDFENQWQIMQCEDLELDPSQFESELVVTPLNNQTNKTNSQQNY